jgi:hypothetical protein
MTKRRKFRSWIGQADCRNFEIPRLAADFVGAGRQRTGEAAGAGG